MPESLQMTLTAAGLCLGAILAMSRVSIQLEKQTLVVGQELSSEALWEMH